MIKKLRKNRVVFVYFPYLLS